MVREVADGVHLLDVGWPEPVGSNAYLVDDGDLTLVDAGLPVGRRSLAAEIRRTGRDPGALDRVLLTHYDVDHVGGLRRLDVDVPVFLGARDVRLVRRDWTPPAGHHKGLFHRVTRRLFPMEGVDLRPVGDGNRLGGFRAIHTPGHNPGHTVYLHDESASAFLGDLVWEDDGEFVAPSWLDSYDTDDLAWSIRRVAEESFDHGCVGHGDPYSPDADAALGRLAAAV